MSGCFQAYARDIYLRTKYPFVPLQLATGLPLQTANSTHHSMEKERWGVGVGVVEEEDLSAFDPQPHHRPSIHSHTITTHHR